MFLNGKPLPAIQEVVTQESLDQTLCLGNGLRVKGNGVDEVCGHKDTFLVSSSLRV